MAVQTTEEFKNGGATSYAITIEYLQASDIKVRIDGTLQTYTTGTPGSGEYSVSGTTVTLGAAAPSGSGNVHIYRETDVNTAAAVFAAGSSIRATDLNAIHDMARFGLSEARSKVIESDIKDEAITSAKIKNATIVDADISGSAAIAQSKIATGQLPSGITITSANIATGTIVNDDISNSAAIAGSKILPNFGSQNIITSGTVDGRDVSTDGTKLDGIESGATADQTNAEIKAAYEANANTNEFSDAEQTKLANIETAATADQTAAEIKTLLQSDKLELSEIDTTSLDSRYFTETESDARYFRQDSTETIASGDTWSSADTHVATTGAINARIIDLVDEVGGFTVIATELVFPNSNPQGATGQSAIMSIGALTQSYTPSGTTVTIANGTVGNSTVTITGVPSVLPQGFGVLVESTSTLNTYTFHRLVPKATEVTTVATNISNVVLAGQNVSDINNFVDLYQISNSAPTQRADGNSLQVGDLWFDNANDTLRVYDGTNWAIISPSQTVLNDISIVSGAITYQEDLGLISDAVTTGSSNGSLDIVADMIEDEVTFTVTAATGKFIIDGVDKPALTLYKGWTYTFDVSDASNANHPFRFYAGSSQYSTNVTVTGTQGQAGAKVVIKIPETQPSNFQYYCTNHSGMGNTITVKDDPIKTVSDSITNINAVAGNSTNINAVAGNATNINTVAGTESNINRYADEYTISSSNPSSPSAGDLWFSTTANILNFYNGTAWVGISPGIAGLINDANPQLANHLDCNDKNLTEVATISGNNLQLDFGTL